MCRDLRFGDLKITLSNNQYLKVKEMYSVQNLWSKQWFLYKHYCHIIHYVVFTHMFMSRHHVYQSLKSIQNKHITCLWITLIVLAQKHLEHYMNRYCTVKHCKTFNYLDMLIIVVPKYIVMNSRYWFLLEPKLMFCWLMIFL